MNRFGEGGDDHDPGGPLGFPYHLFGGVKLLQREGQGLLGFEGCGLLGAFSL